MKIITINIPDQYLKAIQALVDLELFQSRCDFVREAIKDFLKNQKSFSDNLVENTTFELFKEIKKSDIVVDDE